MIEALKKWGENEASPSGEVAVRHVPTGFLMIRREALEQLIPHVEAYESFNGRTGKVEHYYNFFPIRVQGSVLESEDWAFCSICREHQIPVMMNYKVRLSHQGSYTFKAE
jgi:hypothetical protein